MTERWLAISGHPKYEISTQGNIRNKDTGKLLKPILGATKNRYYRVSLDGEKYYVHRLMADSFLARPASATTVKHIDGNKLNNNLANLQWRDNGSFDPEYGYIDPDEETGDGFFEGC